ncbi:MAG: hypothetical protein SOS98_01760 [Varibaculum sp.]|nr:hypothetical protein [Varibaculum sp.]
MCKAFASILVLFAAFTLTACGDTQSGQQYTEAPVSDTENTMVAVSESVAYTITQTVEALGDRAKSVTMVSKIDTSQLDDQQKEDISADQGRYQQLSEDIPGVEYSSKQDGATLITEIRMPLDNPQVLKQLIDAGLLQISSENGETPQQVSLQEMKLTLQDQGYTVTMK